MEVAAVDSGPDLARAPIGARGRHVVGWNNTLHGTWIAELMSKREVAKSSLAREKEELARALKTYARESTLLGEHHIALAHARTKLTDYLENITLNLPSNPASPNAKLLLPSPTAPSTPPPAGQARSPRAASSSAVRGSLSVTSSAGGVMSKPPHGFAALGGVLAGGEPPPSPVGVEARASELLSAELVTTASAALPSAEVLSTPYEAAHKYLARHERVRQASDELELVQVCRGA